MHLEDLLPAAHVGIAHHDLPVKPAGAQKRRIQNIPAVGGRHDDDAAVGGKAVHLHQHLVKGLLPLVVSAAQAGAALAADRVDLIDKHNAGCVLFGLLKQVAHAGSAHTHEHLHKIGTGNGVEGHAGLPRHRAGQKRLAGARRAHQQHALGNTGAQGVEFARAFEELDDLHQFLLLLIGAGHIRKGHLAAAILRAHLRLAEAHHLAAALGLAHHVIPEGQHSADQQDRGHQGDPPGGFRHRGPVVDDGVVGMLGVVGLHVIFDLVDKLGHIGHLVGLHLVLAAQLKFQHAAAQVQLIFFHLALLEIGDNIRIPVCGNRLVHIEHHRGDQQQERKDHHINADAFCFFLQTASLPN